MEDLCLALPPLNGDEGLVFHRHQPVTPDASHATCTTARRHPSSDHDYTALRSQVLWGAHEPTIVSLSSRNLARLRDSTWCASLATRSDEHGAGPTHQPMMHLIYLLLSTATSRKRLVVV